MVREIVFDTETTGFYPESGDKLVDIGAVELINHVPTGKTYHQYINPERNVPEETVKVHGLTNDFLKDYPVFADIAQDFIDFVGDDGILVAHNARKFDIPFLNYELKKAGFKEYTEDRFIDTLEIAQKMFPGARNNLDALCKRFGVDNSKRTLHGALLDADLLAEVYLELLGGAEPSMLADGIQVQKNSSQNMSLKTKKNFYEPRLFALSEEEENMHREFLESKIKNSIWLSDESTGTDN